MLARTNAPRVFEKDGWTITGTRGPMANSLELERIATDLGLPRLPDMVFAHSSLSVSRASCGFSLSFRAVDALALVDNTQEPIKVAMADKWARSKDSAVTKQASPYDWTFSTPYAGTLQCTPAPQETDERIDIEKLKRPEPILHYDEAILFEDELADNGSSQLQVKVRVMPSGFFVLLRSLVRVDGVLTRFTDTRVHHEFGKDYVLRETSVREQSAAELEKLVKSDEDKRNLTNPNFLLDLLPVRSERTEKLIIS